MSSNVPQKAVIKHVYEKKKEEKSLKAKATFLFHTCSLHCFNDIKGKDIEKCQFACESGNSLIDF